MNFLHEMANGSKRSRNFTENEKQYLLCLVEGHKDIISSKKSSARAIQRKNQVWEEITEAYNRNCTTGYRDTSQLRHFYNNIKHRVKKFLNDGAKNIDEHSSASDLNMLHSDYMNTDSGHGIRVSVDGSRIPGFPDEDGQNGSFMTEPAFNGHSEDPLGSSNGIEEIVCQPNSPSLPGQELYSRPALGRRKLMKPTRTPLSKPMLRNTSEYLKRIYYKQKIELVNLQKKNEFTKFCNDQLKHQIEMQILRLQLQMVKEGKSISQ